MQRDRSNMTARGMNLMHPVSLPWRLYYFMQFYKTRRGAFRLKCFGRGECMYGTSLRLGLSKLRYYERLGKLAVKALGRLCMDIG